MWLRNCNNNSHRFVETHFEAMSELFAADPFLLPIFVRVCPKMERPFLIPKLPPHVSLSWLSQLNRECKNWRNKVCLICNVRTNRLLHLHVYVHVFQELHVYF